jgi:hypothetical protein
MLRGAGDDITGAAVADLPFVVGLGEDGVRERVSLRLIIDRPTQQIGTQTTWS